MDCPTCAAPMVTFGVSEQYREHAPDGAASAALCPECLTLAAAESAPADPAFDRISQTFPTGEAAVPMALAIGLLDSLALHRSSIEALLEATVESGADPLLVLDRLGAQGGVDPVFDLERRRHQVEQLFG